MDLTLDNPKIRINTKCIKYDEAIYFNACDIILALHKTKNAGHSIETLIDTLVRMENDSYEEL